MSISRIAAGLGVAWNTANTTVLAAGQHLLIKDPSRFEGVNVIGVDEHAWQHVTGRDRFVTVIIDLTPVRDKTGPARLLDMVAGRSKKVFKDWLAARDKGFRDGIEQVAMESPRPPKPRHKPSTDGSNTSAEPSSASEIWPATSPARSSTAEDSDPSSTPYCEEPV